MNLLEDIRNDLVNPSASLSNTLRKAKILARELGSPEFREWVDWELGGYPDNDKLPRYRSIRATNLGTFLGPGALAKSIAIPTTDLPTPLKDFAENLRFRQSVGELEGVLALDSDSLENRWRQEFVMLARDTVKMTGGMELIGVHQPITASTVAGILDNVKTKLLDFVMDLQENNVTPSGLGKEPVQPELVRNFVQNNFYGDHAIVASGENVHQVVNPVQKGNIDSLLNHLRGENVNEDDLQVLKESLSQDKDTPNGELGPMTRAWVGDMVTKAATGAWKIGLDKAGTVLMTALNNYQGQ